MKRDTSTMTCSVCGQDRPTEFIGTQENKRGLRGTRSKVVEVVYYCNDKAECTAAAPKMRLQSKGKQPTPGAALALRDRRPVGE